MIAVGSALMGHDDLRFSTVGHSRGQSAPQRRPISIGQPCERTSHRGSRSGRGTTTPTPGSGAQSRWPRAVARLRLALRSPAAAASSARRMGCFWPAPAPAMVSVAVKESNGKQPEVEKEPARDGGEDVWSAQAEVAVEQDGGFPEHLVVMVNGLVGSADDWKFAAEQFVRRMPGKVIVHR
ncbi:hypothetical protein GUJ93_ZPchr0010g7478 [Zizania palustris]|uniref:DUF676 domain-containing protein n=1 Tax=Zizania palustris TaxID=103762 RepID=A0A8J6BQG1_ZIZPA|nr:hypothetical protein GUJ93_ZPchr0010g7478 [Zizania palustris]